MTRLRSFTAPSTDRELKLETLSQWYRGFIDRDFHKTYEISVGFHKKAKKSALFTVPNTDEGNQWIKLTRKYINRELISVVRACAPGTVRDQEQYGIKHRNIYLLERERPEKVLEFHIPKEHVEWKLAEAQYARATKGTWKGRVHYREYKDKTKWAYLAIAIWGVIAGAFLKTIVS